MRAGEQISFSEESDELAGMIEREDEKHFFCQGCAKHISSSQIIWTRDSGSEDPEYVIERMVTPVFIGSCPSCNLKIAQLKSGEEGYQEILNGLDVDQTLFPE